MARSEQGTDDTHYGPGGRGFYGAVTVSERGQIVIPAAARRDLGIRPGDKLLVLGDPEQGIALMTINTLMRNLRASSSLLHVIEKHLAPPPEGGENGDDTGT